MPEDAVIYTTPKVLQVCLELDFLFHDIFPGARVCLDFNEAVSARCLVYLEYDFEMHIAHAIKGAGKRLVLMHLGDETGIKDLSAYIVADAVLRNYYRPDIFSDERWAWKLRWMPTAIATAWATEGVARLNPPRDGNSGRGLLDGSPTPKRLETNARSLSRLQRLARVFFTVFPPRVLRGATPQRCISI